MPIELKQFDDQYRKEGYEIIAGVDEAGRGPLAGPVVVASVILPPDFYHPEINDSKKLKETQRNRLEQLIRKVALDFQISVISHHTIDEINIRKATLSGMHSCLDNMIMRPGIALVDGETLSVKGIPTRKVIHGDGISLSIAAASILAKTFRDRLMMWYHHLYPEYGFDKHKGYGTASHREIIKKLGPSPIHRKTFLKNLMNW